MFLNQVSHHWIVNPLHNLVLGQSSVFLPPIYIQSEKFAETVCLEGSLSRFSQSSSGLGRGKGRHPFPSTDYLSALFARRYFFSPTPIFPFFPPIRSLVPGYYTTLRATCWNELLLSWLKTTNSLTLNRGKGQMGVDCFVSQSYLIWGHVSTIIFCRRLF